MYCKNCGQELRENVAFCENCGMSAGQGINYCGNCGNAVLPGAYVCPSCGTPTGNAPQTFVPGDDKMPSNSGFAIASLVLGLVGICCCGWLFIPEILAIVFGIVALKNHCSNSGLAIAGIILGGVSLLLIFGSSIVIPLIGSFSTNSGAMTYGSVI